MLAMLGLLYLVEENCCKQYNMTKQTLDQPKLTSIIGIQCSKAIDELLYEAFVSGYSGFLDIWFAVNQQSDSIVLDVKSARVPFANSKLSSPNCSRYQIDSAKGTKPLVIFNTLQNNLDK